MGYLTYKAEKGTLGLAAWLFRFILLLCALLWPLAVGEHREGQPSWIGWTLEVPWLLIVGAVVLLARSSKGKGTRRSR